MNELDKYVEKIKTYQRKNPQLTELELIRYVYIDLGKKLSFDLDFIPFGNAKKKEKIYKNSSGEENLNKCMERNIIICKSSAYITEYILKQLGVNIETVRDPSDDRELAHIHNIVYPKDGSKPYTIDMQMDIHSIRVGAVTQKFGLSPENSYIPIIPRKIQEEIDKKIGYIDDEHYYYDEYIDLLRYDLDVVEDFEKKVELVLEHMDLFDRKDMGYTDRQWHHVWVFENLFTSKEFDYFSNNSKIRMIDCYKDINGIRKYLNCLSVQTKHGNKMYIYNNKLSKYCYIDMINFAKAVQNGMVVHKAKIQGLNAIINRLKNEGR
ncbi:MAG: hypothetical protein IKF38_04020 [Clostridia bacterium]|nr:hypothetical protein [Clostridia bacterium]